MGFEEINEAIESWSYIEAGLRRARNREDRRSAVWVKLDNQLKSVSDHLDRLELQRDRLRNPAPVPKQRAVRFVSIEAV